MSGALNRLTKRRIPDALTRDVDTAQFMQAIIDQLAAVAGSGATAFTGLTDTFSTYAGLGGFGVRVKADESGLEAVSGSGSPLFIAPDQAITASTAIAGIPHGLTLTSAPKVRAYLVNVTPELGYAAGELVPVSTAIYDFWNSGTSTHQPMGCTVSVDAANVYITYGTNASVFILSDRSTGSFNVITPARWLLRVAVEP